jgi:cell division septation protein DedD
VLTWTDVTSWTGDIPPHQAVSVTTVFTALLAGENITTNQAEVSGASDWYGNDMEGGADEVPITIIDRPADTPTSTPTNVPAPATPTRPAPTPAPATATPTATATPAATPTVVLLPKTGRDEGFLNAYPWAVLLVALAIGVAVLVRPWRKRSS